MSLYIGTSGFTLQNFYPSTVSSPARLQYYASVFSTVEINSTFYHIPRQSTIKHWQETVPKEFVFSFKVFQGFTHDESLNIDKELLEKWFAVFSPFATTHCQHVMLFQFPASRICSATYLQNLLSALPKTFKYAFEFRHPSWFVDHIFQLVLENQATIVYSDSPVKRNGEPLWPKLNLPNAFFGYMRLHGRSQLYRSAYTPEQLQIFAELIKKKLNTEKDRYVYFNNTIIGHATVNAQQLMKLMEET